LCGLFVVRRALERVRRPCAYRRGGPRSLNSLRHQPRNSPLLPNISVGISVLPIATVTSPGPHPSPFSREVRESAGTEPPFAVMQKTWPVLRYGGQRPVEPGAQRGRKTRLPAVVAATSSAGRRLHLQASSRRACRRSRAPVRNGAAMGRTRSSTLPDDLPLCPAFQRHHVSRLPAGESSRDPLAHLVAEPAHRIIITVHIDAGRR
jgi:hypothetical protein